MGRGFLVVAAVLGMILGVAAWSGNTASSGSRASKATTLRVDSRQTSVNPGSTTTITNDYFQGTNKIGSDQIACVLTGPGPLAVCTATHMLPKGELITVGSVTIPPPVNQKFSAAIVGGTGPYSTARGTDDSTPSSPTESAVNFHITG
jgi:hypothetical protein